MGTLRFAVFYLATIGHVESSLSLCQTATFRTSVVAPRGARPLYARGPSAWHSPGHTPYPRYACIGP
ncbi:unnamed protein product [Lampetra fluviatilis]